jgi:membrane protein required for colicin V production
MSDSVNLTNFDYIIFAIIFSCSLFGFVRGFIKSLLSFCSWILVLVLVFSFYENVANFLSNYISNKIVLDAVSTIGFYIVLSIIMSLISSKISSLLSFIQGGIIDRSLGFGFGFLKGAFISCGIFWLVTILTSTFSEKHYPKWLLNSCSSQLLYQGTGIILKSTISKDNERLNNLLQVDKFKIGGNVEKDLFVDDKEQDKDHDGA